MEYLFESTKKHNGNVSNNALHFTFCKQSSHTLFHLIHLTIPVKIGQKLLHSVIDEEIVLQKADVNMVKIKHEKEYKIQVLSSQT